MIKFTTKLFLILAATLLPTGVWGDNVINVTHASDFGTQSSGYYSLTSGNTYTLQEDIILEGYLLILGNVTIDLNGHILDRNLTEALTNGFVIRINSNGILTISDTGGNGTIRGGFHKHNTGNTNSYYGGGICNFGQLILQGGTITGNRQDVDPGSVGAGGVYNVGSNATLTISGNVSVTGNYVGETENNIFIPSTPSNIATIKIGEGGLTGANGSIGITAEAHGVFTKDATGDDYKKFKSDDTRYVISKVNDTNRNARFQAIPPSWSHN